MTHPNWLVRLLCWLFHFKEIGWKEIGEVFYRWTLCELPTGHRVYLHRLDAKLWHEQCHDHPWDFLAIILYGGYYERLNGKTTWHGVGSVLWRLARSSHNVMTPQVNWSLVIVSPKKRDWGMKECVA